MSNIDDIFYFAQDDIAYVIGDSTSSPEKWKHYCRAIGMKTNKYFNSGVLLLNISKYLKNDIGIKALLLLKNNQYKYMDQDVLNILLEGKCSYDPDITYNCTMSVTNDKYQKYLDDGIKIVHFTGDKNLGNYLRVSGGNGIILHLIMMYTHGNINTIESGVNMQRYLLGWTFHYLAAECT